MKRKLNLTLTLIILLALRFQESSATGVFTNSHPTNHTIMTTQEKSTNDIATSPLLILTIIALFVFNFQAAIGQEEIYRPTQEQLDNIAEVKKDVDAGVITQANWNTQVRYKRTTIQETLDPEARKISIAESGYNAAGKKAMTAAYDGLARSLAKSGISNEEPMDAVLKSMYDEVVKTITSVNNYKPGDLYMVGGSEKIG